MAKVFHVVERYLDISAGFVHTTITGSRHDAVVLSRLLPANAEAFPIPALRQVPSVIDHLPQGPIRDRALRAAVVFAARRARADLAHVHFGYPLPYATAVASRGRLPLVVSLHGHDVTAWPALAPWAYPNAIDHVAAIVVPSRWLAARAIALGFPDTRVHVIPSGVDTAFFAPTPLPNASRPIVAFVGRLVEKKGIDVLLDAWPAIAAAAPDARLVVVGSGPLESRVAALAATTVRVELRSPDVQRRREQVRDVLRAATVVVTPSQTAADGDSESLLLVNLEAQASGRPLVTTRHGGIPEFVVEDETALVVPEADREALATACIRVLGDAALASHLAANGPANAARFDSAAMVGEVDALYDEVLRRSA